MPKLSLGHHAHHTPRRLSLNSNRSSTADESSRPATPNVEDETVVEPDQGNGLRSASQHYAPTMFGSIGKRKEQANGESV
ncbi:hypothetical protein PRK78_004456 [Emydomyces testavorans]|uniref:Uncharacterized protein n=1 Tax=Emydomyces testavorans TaxID=2070801 RepID=A0AAF0DIU3_9EURO|nr:hypothetical protein PRK78_004456 [Emydomyces testavorans]